MAENILKKLVNNSQIAIDDGVYDVDVNHYQNLIKILNKLLHLIPMQHYLLK